jgi:hypothetical protein
MTWKASKLFGRNRGCGARLPYGVGIDKRQEIGLTDGMTPTVYSVPLWAMVTRIG